MIGFVPYLLVLFGWQPGDVGGSMVLAQSLHPSEVSCQRAGEHALSVSEGVHQRYFCLLAPTQQDIEQLWQDKRR